MKLCGWLGWLLGHILGWLANWAEQIYWYCKGYEVCTKCGGFSEPKSMFKGECQRCFAYNANKQR